MALWPYSLYSSDIFRAYDIRGLYNEEFDEDFAYWLGVALVRYIKARTIVVGRDMRDTSSILKAKIIEGITYAGCDVIDVGVCSSPYYYFSVIHAQADGGVMITASHLGDKYNGFKLTRKNAVVVGGRSDDFQNIKVLIDTHRPEMFARGGTIERKDFHDAYAQALFDKSGIAPKDIHKKVRLEGNTTIIDELGLALLKISVPIDYENPDIIFYFDDDGDRIAVGEPGKGKVRGDLLLGLIASHYFAGKKVVYDVKVAQAVIDYLTEEKGCTMIRCKTGHGFIKSEMVEVDAPFGGEYSGHIMYESMGFVESPGLTMISVLYLIEKMGTSVSELVLPMQKWAHSGEFEFDLTMLKDSKKIILQKLKEKYSDSDIDTLDGVDIRYSNWRMLVRPSGTHPALICIVEGETPELMYEKKQELLDLLGVTEDMMTKWG